MCHFTDDCDAGPEAYWEDTPVHSGGASFGAFGCEACGYSNCL